MESSLVDSLCLLNEEHLLVSELPLPLGVPGTKQVVRGDLLSGLMSGLPVTHHHPRPGAWWGREGSAGQASGGPCRTVAWPQNEQEGLWRVERVLGQPPYLCTHTWQLIRGATPSPPLPRREGGLAGHVSEDSLCC